MGGMLQYLQTPAVELLDGNDERLASAVGRPHSALVNTPEAAFSDQQRPTEPISGLPQLLVREDSEHVLLLLEQLLYAPRSRGQRAERLNSPFRRTRGPGHVPPLELRRRFRHLLRLRFPLEVEATHPRDQGMFGTFSGRSSSYTQREAFNSG